MSNAFPPAGPLDTLTCYPLASQETSTGILGPFSIGWSFLLITYGIVLSQFTRYVQSGMYARDSKARKAITWAVIILNTAVVVQIMEGSFYWTTLQTRDTAHLEAYRPWDSVGPVFSGTLAFLVQGVYAYRSFQLFARTSSKYIFLVFIGTSMLVALAGSLWEATLSFTWGAGGDDKALAIRLATGVWLWASAVVDIANTATLCVLLRSRVKGYNVNTDSVIKSLMLLAVETAAYTTLIATCGALLSVVFTHVTDANGTFQAAFWVPLPSLYAISLFTTLASRDRLVNQMNGSGQNNKNTYTLDIGGSDPARMNQQQRMTGGVHVQHNTVVAVDLGSGEEAHELEEKVRTGTRSSSGIT